MKQQTKIQVEFSHEIKGLHGFFELIISGGKNSIPNPLTLIGEVVCLPHPTLRALEGTPVDKVTKNMLSDYKIRKRAELDRPILELREKYLAVIGTSEEPHVDLVRQRMFRKLEYIDSLKELPLEPFFSIVEFTVEEPFGEEVILKVEEAMGQFNQVLSKQFEIRSIRCEGHEIVCPAPVK